MAQTIKHPSRAPATPPPPPSRGRVGEGVKAAEGANTGKAATPVPKPLIEVARKLRHTMTDAERKLWSRIRTHQLGAHFRRQAPLGPYVLDFVCISARLVIEVDGGQHADSEQDRVRDAWLQTQGFQVLRLWNNEALQNIDGVLETIMAELNQAPQKQAPPPRPSPVKGEGDKQSAPSARSAFAGDDRSAPPAPSPLAGDDQSAPPALSPLAGDDQSAPPALSPLAGDDRSAPPAPSPLAGDDRSAPPAPSPLAGDDRSAPPAPSPLVGEGWGGGR